jgi:hypothetical protein
VNDDKVGPGCFDSQRDAKRFVKLLDSAANFRTDDPRNDVLYSRNNVAHNLRPRKHCRTRPFSHHLSRWTAKIKIDEPNALVAQDLSGIRQIIWVGTE